MPMLYRKYCTGNFRAIAETDRIVRSKMHSIMFVSSVREPSKIEGDTRAHFPSWISIYFRLKVTEGVSKYICSKYLKNSSIFAQISLGRKTFKNGHFWKKTIGSSMTLWSKRPLFFEHPPIILRFIEISLKMHQYRGCLKKMCFLSFFWSNLEHLRLHKSRISFASSVILHIIRMFQFKKGTRK